LLVNSPEIGEAEELPSYETMATHVPSKLIETVPPYFLAILDFDLFLLCLLLSIMSVIEKYIYQMCMSSLFPNQFWFLYRVIVAWFIGIK
jgi:hypothetical protein